MMVYDDELMMIHDDDEINHVTVVEGFFHRTM
jgi:hypothetical protein